MSFDYAQYAPILLTKCRRAAEACPRAKTAYRDRLRAQIVSAAARDRSSARIATDLYVRVDTIRK